MAPEKNKLLKEVASWIGASVMVGGFIFSTGSFVASTKNTASDVIELQKKTEDHEKHDVDFQHEVSVSLTDLKIQSAKMNQSLEDLKATGKVEIEYHKATLNILKK